MKLNEIGDWIRDENRGVSPVIGVILMVAITVILAAVIAAFVLDLGSSVESGVQAGANIDSSTADNRLSVTFTSAQDSDTTLEVTVTNLSNDATVVDGESLGEIGDTKSWDDADGVNPDGENRVVIVAVNEDRRTTIQTTTVDLS